MSVVYDHETGQDAARNTDAGPRGIVKGSQTPSAEMLPSSWLRQSLAMHDLDGICGREV